MQHFDFIEVDFRFAVIPKVALKLLFTTAVIDEASLTNERGYLTEQIPSSSLREDVPVAEKLRVGYMSATPYTPGEALPEGSVVYNRFRYEMCGEVVQVALNLACFGDAADGIKALRSPVLTLPRTLLIPFKWRTLSWWRWSWVTRMRRTSKEKRSPLPSKKVTPIL